MISPLRVRTMSSGGSYRLLGGVVKSGLDLILSNLEGIWKTRQIPRCAYIAVLRMATNMFVSLFRSDSDSREHLLTYIITIIGEITVYLCNPITFDNR